MDRELYIGNLSPTTTPAALQRAFAPWGGRYATVERTRPGIPSTHGYVLVPEDQAEAAIEAMHEARIDGRPILVYESARQESVEGIPIRPRRAG